MSNLLMTIKRIVHDTVKSMVMCDNLIGTVVSESPLKISINEKMILEDVHFIKLKNAIGNFPVEEVEVEGVLHHEGTHTIKSKGKGVCKHRLKKGSKVVLSRCFGGEQYVILGELIE